MNTLTFREKKRSAEKITMVTCYDFTSAQILDKTEIDALLVGDSLAMTMYGESTTLPATMEMMALHTRAVVKGAPNKFIVGDLPFLSFRMSLSENMNAVKMLMQAGAHAVKLEGVAGNEDLIQHIVESGVPVMGHLGLTPQSIHQLGGFKVQGRQADQREKILAGALKLQELGCFSVVLECVPSSLARTVSEKLEVPTIGIGAGPDTDGQILVWQDVLGMSTTFNPKFVRRYLDGQKLIAQALDNYVHDVKTKSFPSIGESYE